MNLKKNITAAAFASVAAVTSFIVLPGMAAHADPPSCSKRIVNFSGGNNGTFNLYTRGSCSTNPAYHVLYAEVKQDLNFLPDPVALSGADAGVSQDWVAIAQGCDNNNTAKYYGRTYFSGYTDYLDTAHNQYDSC